MAIDYEYYSALYQQRMAALDAVEAQTEANLKATYSVGGDPVEDQEGMQRLANIRQEKRNLYNFAQEQVAQAQPYTPPQRTPEEEAVRPIEDWNDTWEMVSKGCTESEKAAMIPGFQRGMAFIKNGGTR